MYNNFICLCFYCIKFRQASLRSLQFLGGSGSPCLPQLCARKKSVDNIEQTQQHVFHNTRFNSLTITGIRYILIKFVFVGVQYFRLPDVIKLQFCFRIRTQININHLYALMVFKYAIYVDLYLLKKSMMTNVTKI